MITWAVQEFSLGTSLTNEFDQRVCEKTVTLQMNNRNRFTTVKTPSKRIVFQSGSVVLYGARKVAWEVFSSALVKHAKIQIIVTLELERMCMVKKKLKSLVFASLVFVSSVTSFGHGIFKPNSGAEIKGTDGNLCLSIGEDYYKCLRTLRYCYWDASSGRCAPLNDTSFCGSLGEWACNRHESCLWNYEVGRCTTRQF